MFKFNCINLIHSQCSRKFHRSIGLVGMPNVGKSTLFNALTRTENAQAANYPFCTIDPNIARVGIPDPRLNKLAEIANSQKVIETQLEFVDIAGLVRGASKGEGLGNKFLENIRQVAVVAHVVRCFEDHDILHVEESVDPIRDINTIQNELILSDLQQVEKRLATATKKARSGDKESIELIPILDKIIPILENGNLLNQLKWDNENDAQIFHRLQLLSSKKAMYICNVQEDDAADGNQMTHEVHEKLKNDGNICLIVSASLEDAAAGFETEDAQLEYLKCCGLEETGLSKIIRKSQKLLGLQTFYTVGQKESRAWSIPEKTLAPKAAGVIHSDFERLFIRAETISYNDYIESNGEKLAKEKGLMRIEGKEYICQDGDIFHFLVGK